VSTGYEPGAFSLIDLRESISRKACDYLCRLREGNLLGRLRDDHLSADFVTATSLGGLRVPYRLWVDSVSPIVVWIDSVSPVVCLG
jgi:hypothetical protein